MAGASRPFPQATLNYEQTFRFAQQPALFEERICGRATQFCGRNPENRPSTRQFKSTCVTLGFVARVYVRSSDRSGVAKNLGVGTDRKGAAETLSLSADGENSDTPRLPKFVDLMALLERRAQSLSAIHSDREDKRVT